MLSDKSILIPCKPYVKQFLIQNYGYPVNLYTGQNPFIHLFRSFLEKSCHRRDKALENKNNLTAEVDFLISDGDFYRNGWEISLTHISILNTSFEQAAKLFMRNCICFDISLTGSKAKSIRKFQDRYDYPDEVWPYQSIKKDLDRNVTHFKMDIETDVSDKIQEIVLGNLYKLGTLTKINPYLNENSTKRAKQPGRHSNDLRCAILHDSDTAAGS